MTRRCVGCPTLIKGHPNRLHCTRNCGQRVRQQRKHDAMPSVGLIRAALQNARVR